MTKLGIISDTHGCVLETQAAIDIFRRQDVSIVIHCGDIGSEDIVRLFRGIETHFVMGNTDADKDRLRRVATENGNTLHGWTGSLELDGKKICFMHGHRNDDFENEVESGYWDLICYGHTHFPAFHEKGGTLLVNPGAFQRVTVPRIAVITLPEMTLESFAVE